MPSEHLLRSSRFYDRRSIEIDTQLDQYPLWDLAGPAGRFIVDPRDPQLARSILQASRQQLPSQLYEGRVQYALGRLGWYRVALERLRVVVPAYAANPGVPGIFGPGVHRLLAPDTPVLVLWPGGGAPAVILAVLGGTVRDGSVLLPDYVAVGWRQFYNTLVMNRLVLEQDARHRVRAVDNYSRGEPVDQLPGDYTILSPTGLGLHIDNFLAFLRASDAAGLFLFYEDQAARLCGQTLELWAAGSTELRTAIGSVPFFYRSQSGFSSELLGLVQPAPEPDAGLKRARALELESLPGWPIARWQEACGPAVGGYLRQMTLPVIEPQEQLVHRPLVRESVYFDGRYSLAALGGLVIGKPAFIQPLEGLEAYRPSLGWELKRYGRAVDQELDSPQHPAMLLRWARYLWNFAPLDTAHRRELLELPDEVRPLDGKSVASWFLARQPPAKDASGRRAFAATEPQEVEAGPVRARVWPGEALLGILPDGQLVLQGSCGESIAFVQGDIVISAPRRILVQSGESAVVLAGKDVVLRARKDLELSSARRAVRIKAEQELQLLGGNGGEGGVLVESRGRSRPHYPEQGGAAVRTEGVTIKSQHGRISLLSEAVSIQSLSGPVVIDAAQGTSVVYVSAQSMVRHLLSHAQDIFGRADRSPRVDYHGPQVSRVDASLTITGSVVVGGFGLMGGPLTLASGNVATPQGGPAGRILDLARVRMQLREATVIEPAGARQQASSVITTLDILRWPRELAEAVSFSFRASSEYSPQELVLLQPVWHYMLDKDALALDKVGWEEPPVYYQGIHKTYPWPGKEWKDVRVETFLPQREDAQWWSRFSPDYAGWLEAYVFASEEEARRWFAMTYPRYDREPYYYVWPE